MMTRKVDSLRRAANAAVERLVALPDVVTRSGFQKTERKDALAEARAIKIVAAGILAAAEAAIAELQDPPPPANHYHQAPLVPRLRDPRGGGVHATAQDV